MKLLQLSFSKMSTFICTKCGAQVQKDTQPGGQCPKGGFHNWSRV